MSAPIAVFDSGLGGLSVVRCLQELLPDEPIVYFGDTARVPYGTKSRQTVTTFSLEAARFLMQFDPKLFVAACNTASALALPALRRELSCPVLGVVEPGARAAALRCQRGAIAVIGTEATVNSRAYELAIAAIAPQVEVVARACPLLVPLVEEGRAADDAVVRLAVQQYLAPLRDQGVSALVLGCTHYPLLRDAITRAIGAEVEIIDSGEEAARAAQQLLSAADQLHPAGNSRAALRCFVSDNPARFRQIGSRFLRQALPDVELVELAPVGLPGQFELR